MSSRARLLVASPAATARWLAPPANEDATVPPAEAPPTVSLEDAAYARGFADGQRAGQQAAVKELRQAVAALTAALGDAADDRAQLLVESHRQLVEVAVAMARHIVHRHVEYDVTVVTAMAQAAIGKLRGAGGLEVRLNPRDHAQVVAASASMAAGLPLVADPAIEPAGCRILSSFGEVDAGMDAQLAELSRALFDQSADVDADVDGD